MRILLPYFYRPIAHYNGRVLKCVGMVTDENREWLKTEYPEGVELPHYGGDRIFADTLQPFALDL